MADFFVGLPFVHVKGMREDAGARLHFEQGRTQLQVEVGQQVHGDHGGFVELFLKNVALADADLVGDTGGACIVLRMQGHLGVVFDAVGPGAKLLGGGDGNDAVTGPQVINDVLARDLGHVEHAGHQLGRGGNPNHILAALAALGLVVRALGGGTAHQKTQGQGSSGSEAAVEKRFHVL